MSTSNPSSAVPILEVKGVSRRFGKFQALHNISTRFFAGELMAVVLLIRPQGLFGKAGLMS